MLKYYTAAILILFSYYGYTETNQPHEHTGILTPYTYTPEAIKLSEAELKKLKNNRPVYKKIDIANTKQGIAIFRVNAAPDVIWSVLRDFESYPDWIQNVTATEIYKTDGNKIYVRYKAKHWLTGESVWYAQHDYPLIEELKERNWGSWTLDYTYRSDFDDSVGFWQVTPIQGEPNTSQVIYSADLRLKGKVPAFIQTLIRKKGLKQATKWVKVQAEARALQ